jgi:prepilin-type N-terminal cleavage/methylation domain-containing protein
LEPSAKQNASSPLRAGLRARWSRFVQNENGFTLIELSLVVALIGITSGMFAVTYGTMVTRSSEVSAQNILQTEVRGSLNQLVSDLRTATTGNATPPIITFENNRITFYSPDRMQTSSLRKVEYWLDGTPSALAAGCLVSGGCTLRRRITRVTSYDTQGNPVNPGDTGPVETIVATVRAPAIAAQPEAPQSGWAAGQIFKYCAQNPLDLRPLEESASPDPITWTCTNPGTLANIKTIVVRAAISATPRSKTYTFGAVATLRWNAS